MSCVSDHREGAVVRVRALPGAKQDGIREIRNGSLVVATQVVAEGGRANEALRQYLARRLAVRKSQIELVAGATSREKRFLVRAVDSDTLRSRVAALLAG
jgi:uncharacterized protein YggU (UPF0235/DUF167 family)